MENPFESGHIKNYLLLYASVVVIMVLFFIATSLFSDIKQHDKKVFNTEINETTLIKQQEIQATKKREAPRFQLMEASY